MLRRIVRVDVAVLLLLFAGTSAAVQAQNIEQSFVQPFQEAEAYLNDGEYEQAAERLEELYAQDASVYVFFDRLLSAYESLKRYDDAVALVDEQLERTDDTAQHPRWMAEKGRLYYLNGDEDQAFSAWENAIAAHPDDAQVYRTVYTSMADVRYFEGAIDILVDGRSHLGDESLFTTELAHLYSLSGEHAEAMSEYLVMLQHDERRLNFVRSRLTRIFEQEGALEASLPVVARAVEEDPLDRHTRELLGWMYLERQEFENALDAYRAIDRLEQEEGAMLLQFADQAADGGAYETAVVAYEEILSRHPESAASTRAQWGRSLTLEQWAEELPPTEADSLYTTALNDYEHFLETNPDHPYYPEVMRRVAGLYQDVFHNYDEAEKVLTAVVERYPDSDAASDALFNLGQVELKRGRLSEAQLTFSRLIDSVRTGSLAEQARFELALLHFYQGEFESATTLASALEGNTSSEVANDAIELKLLIREHEGPDSLHAPLSEYAEARLAYRQHRLEDALARTEDVLDTYNNHPIADRAYFLRAEILGESGRHEDAVLAFREFSERYPHSPLRDKSLFRAAELQQQYGMDEDALETYLEILTDFPGSLLVPDARTRIRTLRGDEA